MPQSVLNQWHGIHQITQGTPTDYEQACSVHDELGEIERAGAKLLVLGDEPHRTAWFESPDFKLFVRWVAAVSETAVLAALAQITAADFGNPKAMYWADQGNQVLIDSAEPGYDTRGDILQILLAPGMYVVDTAHFNSNEDVQLVLHRFCLAHHLRFRSAADTHGRGVITSSKRRLLA